MKNRWILVRAAVWLLVLGWVISVLRQPQVHNELALRTRPPEGADPGTVLSALSAIAAAGCPGETLHVRVGASGLEKAWITPGLADTSCLEAAVAAQAWPALSPPMEMEFPLQGT